MTMTTLTRSALAILAAGSLAAPAAASAKARPDDGRGQSTGTAAHPGKGHDNAKRNPTVTYVFKGTVASVDAATGTAAIKVAKVNHQGRSARGLTVTFDLSEATVAVADINADGAANVADVAAGDRVLVHARLPRRSADLTGTVVARKLVDQTHPARATDAVTEAPAAG